MHLKTGGKACKWILPISAIDIQGTSARAAEDRSCFPRNQLSPLVLPYVKDGLRLVFPTKAVAVAVCSWGLCQAASRTMLTSAFAGSCEWLPSPRRRKHRSFDVLLSLSWRGKHLTPYFMGVWKLKYLMSTRSDFVNCNEWQPNCASTATEICHSAGVWNDSSKG